MIIECSIQNFRSFKEKATLSMLAESGKSKSDNVFDLQINESSDVRLLKSAVMYGANGSGKSNFIRGISVLKYLISESHNFKIGGRIKCYEPFELDVDTKNSPSIMEIQFVLDSIKYSYHISFNEFEIIEEKLIFYPSSYPALLFERLPSNTDDDFTSVELGTKLTDKKIPQDVFKNQLYLSRFGSLTPHQQLTKVFKYLDSLEVWNTLDKLDVHNLSIKISKKLSDKNQKAFSDRLNKLVKVADIKIEDIFTKELKDDDFNIPNEIPSSVKEKFIQDNKFRTFARHKVFKEHKFVGYEEFDFATKESQGTKILFALGGIMLESLEKGGIIFFDELDNSLHSKLIKFLVRLFNNTTTNPKGAQLIFSTHEVTLLDKQIFRKDQIWFTQKSKFGCSELYCAKEIESLRDDTNFELWYRTGKFGGNPKIKEVEFIFENA